MFDISNNEVAKSTEFRMYMIYYLNTLKIINRVVIEKDEINKANMYFDGRITPELLEMKLGTENINNLVEADLSNCKLKDLENVFNNNFFSKLKKLNVSKNMFSSFKIFGYMPTLIELNISYNLFDRILGKLEKPTIGKGVLGIIVSFTNYFLIF